ncbi:MAG: GAF domain-containing protein, partial [Dehalococcoidia bacterium]
MTASSTEPTSETANSWLAVLDRAMRRIGKAQDGPGVFEALAAALVEEFGVAMAAIWIYDPAADTLSLRTTAGLPGYRERAPASLPPRDMSLTLTRVVVTGEPEVIDEIGPEDGFKDLNWLIQSGIRAYAGLPLAIDEQSNGAMSVFYREPWPTGMLDALRALARQAALAIEHTRLIEESNTLQTIAAAVAASRDPKELLHGLVQRTSAALGAGGCAVWLIDEASGLLFHGASVGLSEEFISRLMRPAARGSGANFAEVQRTGQPVYTRNDPADMPSRDRRLAEAIAAEGIVSALRLPLFEPGGHVIGMLALYHRHERHYSENEVRLAQAFTGQIAVALHNARLTQKEQEAQQAARRQLDRLTMLSQATQRLLGSSDVRSVLRTATESAMALCSARASVIALVKPGEQKLAMGVTRGDLHGWFDSFTETNMADAYTMPTPTGEAISTGATVLVPDYASRPVQRQVQADTVAAGVRSLIASPLRKGDVLLGMLWVANSEPYSLTQEDALLMHSLADQVALALEQARLIEESHALQVVAAELASTREAQAMLDGIVQRSMTVLSADGCAVWLIDDDRGGLRLGAAAGLSTEFVEAVRRVLSADDVTARAVARSTRSMTQPSYSADDQGRARRVSGPMADAIAAEGIISALRLPLFEPEGGVVGMLVLYHRRERRYSPGEVRLAQTFTDQVAVGLHNARLADKEREAQAAARRQLERLMTITKITERLLGATELSGVLRVVVEAAGRLSNASGAMVGLIDDEGARITAVASEGEPRGYFERFDSRLLDNEYLTRTPTGQAVVQRTPVVVEDYSAWPNSHPDQEETIRLGVHAFVVAPLLIGGKPIGALWVNDTKPRPFLTEDVLLVQALADQAALAIEHARLVQRGQDAVVLEERTRLARDLHDSVTQSVFSLGMMARAAQTQYSRGNDRLGTTLDRIATLSQDALREMRALLFELQPSGLADDGLGPALRKLAEAVGTRLDLDVRCKGDTELRFAPEVETAFFRIAQEALSNASKHARASSITM